MAELPIIEKFLEDYKRKNNRRIRERRKSKLNIDDPLLEPIIDEQIGVKSVPNREVAQQIESGELGLKFRRDNEDEGQAALRTYDEDNRYAQDAAASETGQYTDKRVRQLRRNKETVVPGRPSMMRYAKLQRGIGKLSGDPNAPLQGPIASRYLYTTGGMTSPETAKDVKGLAEVRRNYNAEEYKQNVAEGKIKPSDDYDDTFDDSYNDTQNFNPEDRAIYSAINQDAAREELARLKSDLESGKYGSTIPKEIEVLYRNLLRTAYPDYAKMYEQNESAKLLAEERAGRRQLARDQMSQVVRTAAASGQPMTVQNAQALLAALQPGAAAQRTNEKVDLERRERNVQVNQDNQLVNLIRQLRGLKPVTPGAAQRYLANMGDLTTLSKAKEVDYSLTNTPSDRRALRTEIVDPNVVFVEDIGGFREATAPFNLVQPIEIQPDVKAAPQADLRQWILDNYLFADSREDEADIFKFDFDSARQSMGSVLSELGKGAKKLKTGAIAQIKKLDERAKKRKLTPAEQAQRNELGDFLQRIDESGKPQQMFKTGVRNLSEVESLIQGAKYLIARGGGLRKEGGLMRGSKMQPDPKLGEELNIDVALNALGITGDNPQMRRDLATSLFMQEMGLMSSVNQEQKIAYVNRDNSLPRTMSISGHPGLIRGAKTGQEPTTLQQLGKEGTFRKDDSNIIARLLQNMGSNPILRNALKIPTQNYGVNQSDFDEQGNLKSDKFTRQKEQQGAARTQKEIELTDRDGSKPNTRISPESKTRMTGIVQPNMEKVRQLSRQLRRAKTLLRQAKEKRPMTIADREPVITSELLQAQRNYDAIRQELEAELPADRQAAFDRNQYVAKSQQQSIDAGTIPADQLTTYVKAEDSKILDRALEENPKVTPQELMGLLNKPEQMKENIIRLFQKKVIGERSQEKSRQQLANEQVRRDRPKQGGGGTPIEQLNQLIEALQGGAKRAILQTRGRKNTRGSQTTIPLEVVDGVLTLKPAEQPPKASGPDVVDQIINKYRAEYEAGGPVNKRGELAADFKEAGRQAREARQVTKNREALATEILNEIRSEPAPTPSPTPAPSTPKQTGGIPTRPSKDFTPPKKKVQPDPGPSKEYTPPPKRSKDYEPPIRKAGTAVQKEKVDPVKKFREEQKVKAPTDNKRRQLLYALGALTGGTAIGAGAMALADREEEEQRQLARY